MLGDAARTFPPGGATSLQLVKRGFASLAPTGCAGLSDVTCGPLPGKFLVGKWAFGNGGYLGEVATFWGYFAGYPLLGLSENLQRVSLWLLGFRLGGLAVCTRQGMGQLASTRSVETTTLSGVRAPTSCIQRASASGIASPR